MCPKYKEMIMLHLMLKLYCEISECSATAPHYRLVISYTDLTAPSFTGEAAMGRATVLTERHSSVHGVTSCDGRPVLQCPVSLPLTDVAPSEATEISSTQKGAWHIANT